MLVLGIITAEGDKPKMPPARGTSPVTGALCPRLASVTAPATVLFVGVTIRTAAWAAYHSGHRHITAGPVAAGPVAAGPVATGPVIAIATIVPASPAVMRIKLQVRAPEGTDCF